MKLAVVLRTAVFAFCAGTLSLTVNAELADSYEKVIERARQEGEIHFMASGETFGGQEVMTRLEQAFNKKVRYKYQAAIYARALHAGHGGPSATGGQVGCCRQH